MLGTLWNQNYTSEVETFVMWSRDLLVSFDRTARIDTKKVSTCRGSFGGFKTTCFQPDQAASFETTEISYFESSGNRVRKQIRLCSTLLACQMKIN